MRKDRLTTIDPKDEGSRELIMKSWGGKTDKK